MGVCKMVNVKYIFHPSSCGYYCLKRVLGEKKIKRKKHMSLYELKENFLKNNWYCVCCRVDGLDSVNRECITLLSTKTNYHYVIIKKINGKFVYLYDPLFLFVRRVRKDKFMKKWSKICLFYIKI